MTLISDGPTTLSPARIRFALLALALGGFGIGSTEFVAMGLLPNIAQDLLPGVYAQSPEEANATAGWIISAYALGVVVGAPTIAAAAARWPRKRLLLALLVAFTLATIASALLPTFGLVLVARFISAVPHGAYFGIASLVAASLMGPGKRARGVALVLSGLTIANVDRRARDHLARTGRRLAHRLPGRRRHLRAHVRGRAARRAVAAGRRSTRP